MGAPKRLDCVLAASRKSARIAAHGGMWALPIDRSEKRRKNAKPPLGHRVPTLGSVASRSGSHPHTELAQHRLTLARPTPSPMAISVGVAPASFGRMMSIACRRTVGTLPL